MTTFPYTFPIVWSSRAEGHRPRQRPYCLVATDANNNGQNLDRLHPTPPVFGSASPGGWNYCVFSVFWPWRDRLPPELAYFRRLEIWEGLSLRWDGEIREIVRSQTDAEYLQVTAYGKAVVLGDFVYNRVWEENRYESWQIDKPNRSEAWEVDTDQRIFIRAKINDFYYRVDDYGGATFRLPASAYHTDTIKRFSATVTYHLGNAAGKAGSWLISLYALDDTGATIVTIPPPPNPRNYYTSGRGEAVTISWVNDGSAIGMPDGCRQIRVALRSNANQVWAPGGHLQADRAEATYFRLQDVAEMASNMVVNPSMEDFPDGATVPNNWTAYGGGLVGKGSGIKHEYASWGLTPGWPSGTELGIRQDVTVVAEQQYFVSVWCLPSAGTQRLKCSNDDDTNMTIIATSSGLALQKLSGTYTPPAGKTVLRYWLEVVAGGTGYFDMAWCDDGLEEPATLEEYVSYGWRESLNDPVNNFDNDSGGMYFEETYYAFFYGSGSSPESSEKKGWRAIVRWEGTGVKFYGMKGVNFGQAIYETYTDQDVSVDGPTTVDCYNDPALFRQELYSVMGLTRGRYYTVITTLRTRNAGCSANPIAYSVDYWVPEGQSFFDDAPQDLQAVLTDVLVATTTATSITADDVAEDIVSKASPVAYGLSSDTSLIASGSTRNLLPLIFDQDETAETCLKRILSPGDHNRLPLQWGVLDTSGGLRLTVEPVPLTTVSYLLPRDQAQGLDISGEVSDIVLETYGVYPDIDGRTARTDIVTSANAADLFGGRKRQVPVQAPDVLMRAQDPRRGKGLIRYSPSDTRIFDYVRSWLNEHDDETVRSEITVTWGLTDAYGTPISLARVEAGKLLQITEPWVSEDVDDLRDNRTIFLVTRTEYDSATGELRLTLGHPYYGFADLMAQALS